LWTVEYQQIKFELDDDGVATVTLAKPPVNALDRRTRDEITHIFDAISDRTDVRVAILTGEGKAFCAGADIKERVNMAHEPGDYLRHNRQTRETFLAIMECSKPIVAAVNGPAIGAGVALMLACDIMYASDNAFLVMPEIDVGLSGGQRLLIETFGKSRSRLMYYTGRRIYAPELYRLGVIEASLPQEQLLAEARKTAAEIAGKNPAAIRSAKKTLNLVEHLPYRVAYPYEQSITAELAKHEDTREAQQAFLEKRKPVFKGR
jgi:enoyl-CoA hydratase